MVAILFGEKLLWFKISKNSDAIHRRYKSSTSLGESDQTHGHTRSDFESGNESDSSQQSCASFRCTVEPEHRLRCILRVISSDDSTPD